MHPNPNTDDENTARNTAYWFFVILSVPAVIMFLFLINGYFGQ